MSSRSDRDRKEHRDNEGDSGDRPPSIEAQRLVRSPAVEHGRPEQRFAALDGLRGVAMTGVFAYHASFFCLALLRLGTSWAAPTTWGARVLPNLNIGVEIFFVLSGFLIYRPYALARAQRRPAPRLGRYLVRRALRIYPAYWVALTVLLLSGAIYVNGLGHGLKHFALLHTYFGDYGRDGTAEPGIDVSWTLVVEVSFYACVPLVAWLARRVSLSIEVVALIGATFVGHAMRIWIAYHEVWSPLRVLPPAFAALAPGMLLAVLSVHDESIRPWLRRVVARPGWWWFAAAIVLLWMTRHSYGTPIFPLLILLPRMKVWHDALAPTVAVLLVSPLVLDAGRRTWIQGCLSHRAIAWVGTVSYGAYLWHHAIMLRYVDIGAVGRMNTFNEMLFVAGLYGVVLAIGAASWYLIERPALRLTDRLRQGAVSGRSS